MIIRKIFGLSLCKSFNLYAITDSVDCVRSVAYKVVHFSPLPWISWVQTFLPIFLFFSFFLAGPFKQRWNVDYQRWSAGIWIQSRIHAYICILLINTLFLSFFGHYVGLDHANDVIPTVTVKTRRYQFFKRHLLQLTKQVGKHGICDTREYRRTKDFYYNLLYVSQYWKQIRTIRTELQIADCSWYSMV